MPQIKKIKYKYLIMRYIKMNTLWQKAWQVVAFVASVEIVAMGCHKGRSLKYL